MIEILKISILVVVFYQIGQPGEIFDWYQKSIANLPEWLWKPLGGCVRCFGGQVCFWYFIIKYFHSYNLLDHLVFTAIGIFTATILNYIYETAKN